MKSKRFVKMIAIVLSVMMLACTLIGCSRQNDEPVPTVSVSEDGSLIWPQVNSVGGYEIRTETMYCKIVVDGEYKYSCFESYTSGRKIEFYASPTEMIMLDANNGVTKSYRETYEDVDQTYTSPLQSLFAELGSFDFKYDKNEIIDGVEYDVYSTTQTSVSTVPIQIQYTVSTIEMTWLDGENYVFKYYDYEDGSTLISAEAPNEINPRIVQDTPWVVDMNNLQIINNFTNEVVNFSITDISTGSATSPDGSGGELITETYTVLVYVNQDNGTIQKIQYERNGVGTTVTILNSADIAKPTIPENSTRMDSATLQGAMMLIYMLESIL